MNEIEGAFQRARLQFFPRWRAGACWSVRAYSRPGTDGSYCDSDRRTIYCVGHWTPTLIHEICHAVAEAGHGKKWDARMRMAADDATRLGDAALAGHLRDEADFYKDTPNTTAADVYRSLEDAVTDGLDSEDAVRAVARDIGLQPRELVTKYKRASHVVDQAVQRRDTRRDARLGR